MTYSGSSFTSNTLNTAGSLTGPDGTIYSEPVITVYGSGEITLMVGMVIVELDGVLLYNKGE